MDTPRSFRFHTGMCRLSLSVPLYLPMSNHPGFASNLIYFFNENRFLFLASSSKAEGKSRYRFNPLHPASLSKVFYLPGEVRTIPCIGPDRLVAIFSDSLFLQILTLKLSPLCASAPSLRYFPCPSHT